MKKDVLDVVENALNNYSSNLWTEGEVRQVIDEILNEYFENNPKDTDKSSNKGLFQIVKGSK